MTQTLISDEDISTLKIQVLECVKELKKAGGPAADRFQTKLSKLIDNIRVSQQDVSSSQKQIGILDAKFKETKNKLVHQNEKIEDLQHHIDCIKVDITRNNQLSQQLEHETEKRNQQVRERECSSFPFVHRVLHIRLNIC